MWSWTARIRRRGRRFTQDVYKRQDAKVARKRTYSIIPDTTGDGTDALIYSGNFRAAGDIVMGTATSKDGWQTATFTEAGDTPSGPTV